jgi:cardiolipin synthase
MTQAWWITAAAVIADLVLRLGLSVRVIMRRPPVGVCLAWLAIILPFPIVGAVVYLFFGEYRLGHSRMRRAAAAMQVNRRDLAELTKTKPVACPIPTSRWAPLVRAGTSLLDAPFLHGNELRLLAGAEAAFPCLIADIDNAQRSCDLEFYIWSPGGCADEVCAAVLRAARRGVRCRLLLDSIGSAEFLRHALSRELKANGVDVRVALTASPLSVLTARPDLRMHRKIVVIDGMIGYAGSLNLADPRYFKQDAGVGQWVDALLRVRGSAIEGLAMVFLTDWAVEAEACLADLRAQEVFPAPADLGPAGLQVLPSGPAARVGAIEQFLLMAIYEARHEIILTTPYFVPSEALTLALVSAPARGVEVTLIVPARVDSRMTQFASRAEEADLLSAGVRVAYYEGGLLHTKSVTVDGEFSLFGSLNLDYRSLHLDFEVSLAIYDKDFTAALRRLQQEYLERSSKLDLAACRARSQAEQFAENVARLAGPVL